MTWKHISVNAKYTETLWKLKVTFLLCSFPLWNIAYKMYKLQIDNMLILTVVNTLIDETYYLVH